MLFGYTWSLKHDTYFHTNTYKSPMSSGSCYSQIAEISLQVLLHDYYGLIFCHYFSFLSQSLQSWLRACGLPWTARPSVPLTSGARSRDTLPNLWAASKSSFLLLINLFIQSRSGTLINKNDSWSKVTVSLFVPLQSAGRPGVSALPTGRPP